MNSIKLTRRLLRTIAFQALFQLDINTELEWSEAIRLSFFTHFEDMDDEMSFESLLETYPELSYTVQVVQGVKANQEKLDQIIQQYAKSWNLTRMIRMDLILMRLAIYEMDVMQDDVPKAVALNEAIEIAKVYSDEKSTRFINGILSNLV